MSLAEVQQVYSTLQEIDKLIGQLHTKTESLRTEAGHARGTLREIEYIFFRVTSLLSKMGLPPEIDAAINKLQRLILTIRLVHSAMVFMQSTTPYMMFLGLLSLGGATASMGGLVGADPVGMRVRGNSA